MLSAFLDGLTGPILVPAHLMALAGLGLLIGQGGARPAAIAAFAAGLGAGLLAIALATGDTGAVTLVHAAALVTGAMAALGRGLHWALLAPLAAAAGAGIGLTSPPEAISIARANATLAGVVCGAIALLAAFGEMTASLRAPWARIGLRIAGSWIAAAGALTLALHLARF